jgi:hypothetical protein
LDTTNTVPTHFFNLTTTDVGTQITRLESATLYPKKGKKKSFKIKENGTSNNASYKYDIVLDHGQVLGPTSGDTGGGRSTPKLKKIVVKAQESCFTSQ